MIVMKFGGTSVESTTAIERVFTIVRGRLAKQPIVVVSAMAKVTDGLVALSKTAAAGQLEKALEQLQALRQRHFATAAELVQGPVLVELQQRLQAHFDRLQDL